MVLKSRLLLVLLSLSGALSTGAMRHEAGTVVDAEESLGRIEKQQTLGRIEKQQTLGSIEKQQTLGRIEKQQSVGIWPFDKKNKTHADNSCSTHKTCDECNSASLCHWCSHDAACHVKGSIHGCLYGATCDSNHPKENSTCFSHTTCSECALSSHLCHWCAHDNACHAVGSIYGCMSGVDCYSNDRCQRIEPEEISGVFIQDVGFLPLLLIFLSGVTCCCCVSVCYCAATGVKGAYDDIVVVASASPAYDETARYSRQPSVIHTPPIPEDRNEDDAEQHDHEDPALPHQADGTDITEEAALLENHMDDGRGDGYSLMTDGLVSAQPSAYATVHARGGSNSMQRLFSICRICYVLSLVATVGLVVGSIRCFPKVPTYNVCNDNLAWKSIVSSMTSMKVEADFEILVSVLNPNHFEVDVEMGRGQFYHEGVFVGTFDIPPTKCPAMSIMDVRVVAHFAPEKWEALSLTAEYYKGTLAFDLNARATFRFPFLFDFAYPASFNNIHVKVNDPKLNDRHLCKCPKWSDVENKTHSWLD